MQGMFKANGGCGYVKKPDFLLKTGPNNEVFDPKAVLPVKTTLNVSALLLGDSTDLVCEACVNRIQFFCTFEQQHIGVAFYPILELNKDYPVFTLM